MISILAPPSDLMPPAPLMSSIARSAPIFNSWPWRAHGPDSGAIIASLTVLSAARTTPGRARAPAAKARPRLNERRVVVVVIILPPCDPEFLLRTERDMVEPALAEIGLDDARVAHDLVGLARGDQPAVVEHGEMVDQMHHRLHRVLDDQHRGAVVAHLADHREDAVEVVVAEPGQGLVEQHQA